MKCYGRNLLAASLLVSTAVCSAAERGSSSAAAAASSKESADHTSTQLRGAAAAAAAANHHHRHHRHHRSLKKEENDHSNNNDNNTKKNKKSERSDDYLASSATFTTTTTTTTALSGTAARGNPGPARQFLSSTSATGSDGTASHSPNAVRSSANSDSASTFRGPEAVASRSSPAYTGGIPCVPSANTKFTCCNNGLSECGGDYDCCDAYRNICVNTANLQGYQLRNLRCKNSSEGQAVSTANNNNNNNNGNNGQKAVKVDEDGKKDIVDASSPQLPPPVIPMIPPKTANKDTNTVDKAVSGSTTAIKNTSYRPYTPPSYTTAAASSSVKTTSAAASSTTVQKVPAIVRASANSDSGTEFRGSSPNDAGSTGTESSSGTQPTTTTTAAGTTTTPRPAATRNSPAYSGIPCVPSANNKFRCCNGGLADCGGDYDCCDAYRNICVNTANLQGYQLRNLRCKGAQQPMVQQVQPLEKEPIDASALDIPAQQASSAPIKDAPAIVRASANSNSGAEFRGPSESAGNSPAATATTTKAVAPAKTTSTTGAAAARSPAFSTGIPCVQSNNAKFRCCNNGLSDCGGDYDCCDAYRNICVNKANLQGYQLRNLKCKGAQTSPQAATPVKIEEAVDVSALDIPPQQVPIPSNEATMTTSYSSNTNNAQSSAKFIGTTTYVDSAPVNVNRGNTPVIAGHQIWYEHEGGNIPQANQEAGNLRGQDAQTEEGRYYTGNSLEISGPSTSNAAVPHSNSNVVTASNANRVSVKDAPCQGSDPAATSYGIVDAYQRWLDHSPANPSVWGSCTATSQCPPGSCCLGHPLGGACINLEDVCEEGERNCPYPNGITVKLCLCDAEPPSNGLAYGPKGNGGGDERPLALGLAEDEFGK